MTELDLQQPKQPSTELTTVKPAPSASKARTMVVCPEQLKIEVAFDETGNMTLTQSNWPEDDSVICVSKGNIEQFIDAMCDALGIPSFGK